MGDQLQDMWLEDPTDHEKITGCRASSAAERQQPDGQSAHPTLGWPASHPHGTDQGVGDGAETRAPRLAKDVE